MKKFRFRLERMLQLKEHKEKERQKNLAQATQKVVNQENHLAGLGQKRLETQADQRGYLTGRLALTSLTMFSRYYTLLKKNELTGRELLRIYQREQEKKRLDLVSATREKKIYEKLKEKKRQAYDKEMETLQQKEQDEIASQMFIHKKKLPL
nr:flagellar export protein FliJ [candidate division Zixibacteria bacterium]